MYDVAQGYRFGGFILNTRQHCLYSAGKEVYLRPKAFETLLCLVERDGRLVTKDELVDAVWSGTSVTDAVLTHCVAEVRSALKDDAHNPQFLKTVPRVGYKFIGEIETLTPQPASSEKAFQTAPASSIVVLPFANLSADAENEYFCDGLSEELINQLTQIETLRVVAHSSAFTFKGKDTDVREIGRTLNVGFVLEGSVRKSGDRLRIAAQLINAADGYHLWSNEFDRRLDDIFAIQDEIATAIVRKLQIAPSVKTELQNRSATSLEAYQFYLKGRSFWHRRYKGFLQKAIECFEQAVAKDPHYALAYTGLADCYLSLGVWGMADPNNVFRRAIALAEKALQIHPDLAEAHASRAVISIFYDWDWMAAERGLKQAIALNPGCAMTHLWYSHYLAILGLLRESVEEARQAQNLDPLSPIINGLLGYTLFLAREYESALLEIRKTLDLDPYFGTAHFLLGTVLAYQGKYSEAIEAQKRCLEMTGGLLQWAAGSLGYASALAGNRRAAGAILKEFDKKQTYIPPSARAMVYLGMGEDEKVYESLRKGYIERDALLPWIKVEPTFDRLRGRPQFKDLLKRMNLE